MSFSKAKVLIDKLARRTRSAPSLRAFWIAALGMVICGSLLPASSMPMSAIRKLHLNDKVEHFMGYAALMGFVSLYESRPALRLMMAGLFVTACLLELLQRCCAAGRTAEIADVFAGTLGLAAGLLAGIGARVVLRSTEDKGPS